MNQRLGPFFALIFFAACGSVTELDDGIQSQDNALQAYRRCDTEAFTPAQPRGFEARRNRIKAVARSRHSIEDTVALPGSVVTFNPIFAYGPFDSRLNQEEVELRVHNCQDWHLHAQGRTDEEGHTHFKLDTQSMGAGQFAVAHQVLGDATVLQSHLYLLPAGTHFVVFDIDGTLTTHDSDLWRDVLYERMLHRVYHPVPYPNAAEITRAWHNKGYVVLYLTARPKTLRTMTDAWLQANEFAPGPLHMAQSRDDWMPRQGRSAQYKARYLRSLQDQGHFVDHAYGNAANDLLAYQQVGIPNVYMVESEVHVPKAIRDGVTTLAGYKGHASAVDKVPRPAQPF